MAVAWLVGLVLARYVLIPAAVGWESLGLLALIPLAAMLLWHQDRSLRRSSTLVLVLLAAALRCELELGWENRYGAVARFNDQGWVTLDGLVSEYPDRRGSWTRLILDADSLQVQDSVTPVRGKVLVRVPRFPEVRYGDHLRVSGLLKTPPEWEDFSYREYLQAQGIHSLIERPQIDLISAGGGNPLRRAIFTLRDRARDPLARLLPEPEASLLQGILLGIESGIPPDLYNLYNATGTSHIIVISGANIALVATFISQGLGRLLGRRRAYWFTVGGILFYVLLAGAEPSAARAGLMGGLYVTARHLGRQATAYVSLLASAAFLTLLNPLALWDLGFQLSFAATLGLILFAPPIESLMERLLTRFVSADLAQKALGTLNDALILSLAAQVLTTPLIVHRLGRLSLVAPLANLLIVPVQPAIMSLGGLAMLVSLVPPFEPVAQVIAWTPWLCLAYTNAVVRWLADWPFASIQIGRSNGLWLIGYLALVLGVAWMARCTQRQARQRRARFVTTAQLQLFVGAVFVAALLLGLAIAQLPDGRLHVAFLDIGQGDAILITTPAGQQILVDGGPDPRALTSALGRQMPFWDRSIDLLVMTHPDEDHIGGLAEALTRFRVKGWVEAYWPQGNPVDSTYTACLELLAKAGVPRRVAWQGDSLQLSAGLSLEVLHPPAGATPQREGNLNNHSLVLHLRQSEASFLLTGDVEAEGEQLLVHSGQALAADVLKVAHHGSGHSSTIPFLKAVAPSYAVISVGAGNRFGHPDPGVLTRLEQAGATAVLRTDEHGTIEFVTDGSRLWIRTDR